ncbi:MAG: hypothetical protein AAF202_11645, partial [Pseudomonadota bacterium]
MKFDFYRVLAAIIDGLIVLTLFFLFLTVFNLIFPSTVVRFMFMSSMPAQSLKWFYIKAAFLPVFASMYLVVCTKTKLGSPFGLWLFGYQVEHLPGVGSLQVTLRRAAVIFFKWGIILFPAPVFAGLVRRLEIDFLKPFSPQTSIAILGLCLVIWLLANLKFDQTSETFFLDRLA